MIKEKDLLHLGFKKYNNSFSKKNDIIYGYGEEIVNICGNDTKLNIIEYYISSQTCSTIRGEYSLIKRKCETKKEIIKFIEAIIFLFNLDLSIINNN